MTGTPYDDAAEATAEWERYRTEGTLARWREQIPARLSAPGDLMPRIAAWAATLAAGQAGNLILAGPVGSGKTWQALHAIEAALEAGWTGGAVFTDAAGWRDTIGPPPDEVALRRVRECGAWVLDDPGAIRLGAWDLEHLYAVVNHRWARKLPVVITSNAADLRELFGERIASRLADGVTQLVVPGPDRRRQS